MIRPAVGVRLDCVHHDCCTCPTTCWALNGCLAQANQAYNRTDSKRKSKEGEVKSKLGLDPYEIKEVSRNLEFPQGSISHALYTW